MKRKLLPAIAVVLALSLSAFSAKQVSNKVLTQKFFDYNKYPSENSADLNDPASYSLVGGTGNSQPSCAGTAHTCGVQANDNGNGQPVIATITQTFLRQ